MRDGQNFVTTMDLELTKAPPEHYPPQHAYTTAEPSGIVEAIPQEPERLIVDSFGKAVLAVASFYEQENITARIKDTINSPEVTAGSHLERIPCVQQGSAGAYKRDSPYQEHCQCSFNIIRQQPNHPVQALVV